ncbi:MAG: hypothetical protein ABJN42_21625 [Roseibium sp.]|uniref:hypothetical protein n=1 Tax=Roseibium sp. TaxID=1936156 RepID=UPI0032978C0D
MSDSPNASFYGGSSKFCVNCKHYSRKGALDLCALSTTGVDAYAMRAPDGICGPNGSKFEPVKAKAREDVLA